MTANVWISEKVFCGVTFVLCGYLLYLEFIWSKTVIAPIRVDLVSTGESMSWKVECP